MKLMRVILHVQATVYLSVTLDADLKCPLKLGFLGTLSPGWLDPEVHLPRARVGGKQHHLGISIKFTYAYLWASSLVWRQVYVCL